MFELNSRFGQFNINDELDVKLRPTSRSIERVFTASTVMEAYYGTAGTPTWQAVGANRLAFTNTLGTGGAASAIDSLPVNTFNLGTHVSNATPVDQCTNPHVPNFQYISSNQWKINNAATTSVADAAVSATQASFRWHFNDASARVIQNVRMYVYDNATVTAFAIGVDVALFVSGNSMTTWFVVNDATTTGPTGFVTGNIGGDNVSERVSGGGLDRVSAATDQYWYCAASAAVESAGLKTSFAFGAYLEYI